MPTYLQILAVTRLRMGALVTSSEVCTSSDVCLSVRALMYVWFNGHDLSLPHIEYVFDGNKRF